MDKTDKMGFFSKDNILVIAADEGKSKSKKGDGINAILGFMQELRMFMEKIEACAEAQDITENKQKIEAISQELEKHWEGLLEIAKGGIKSIRKEIAPDQGLSLGSEPQSPSLPSTPTPIG